MKNCTMYQEYCSAYLDNELTSEEQAQLLAHLAICPDCESYLEELRTLRAQLSPEAAPMPKDLHQSVMELVLTEAQSSIVPLEKKRRHPPVFSMIAAAAAVVLLVTSGALGDVLSTVPENSAVTTEGAPETAASSPAPQQAASPEVGSSSPKMAIAAPKAAASDDSAPAISPDDIPDAITSGVFAYCYVAQGGDRVPDFGGTLIAQNDTGKISYFSLDNNMSTLEKALGKLQKNGFEPQSREDVGGITMDSKSDVGLIIVIQDS